MVPYLQIQGQMNLQILFRLTLAFGFLSSPFAIHLSPALAQGGASTQVITLAEDPGPLELSTARQALANGQVILMEGPDVAKFNSLLNVGLEVRQRGAVNASSLGVPEELQLMAAKLAHNGSLHTYECSVPEGYGHARHTQGQDCTAAFESWLQEERDDADSSALPDPLPADWTELGRPDVDYYDGAGNLLRDRVRLYRVNDNNFEYDWYLIVRDPLSAPNFHSGCGFLQSCGWLTYKRDFQISLDRALERNPGFSVYEWSPVNEIKNGSGEINIGTSLAGVVPQPGVGFSLGWSQPDVGTMVYTNIGAKETSWVESFRTPRTLSNSQPLVTHNAQIFQVPEGTSKFDVRLYTYAQNTFIDFFGSDYSELSNHRTLSVSAPVFKVTPASVAVLPKGNVTLAIEAGIPNYPAQGLRWAVVKEPAGFSVSPTSGSGPIKVNVQATSAQSGDVDFIEFQTDPPFAAPSVARSPLQVRVAVVGSLPPQGVLLAGGMDWQNHVLSSAEVWDPATSTTTPTTAPMTSARRQHTATVLADGRILITGGFDAGGKPQDSAEIFDPATRSFTLAGRMTVARALHTATLLTTGPSAGNVLIVGGCCADNQQALQSAELYNPSSNTFIPTGSLHGKTLAHAATRLSDGSVLITGGTLAFGDIFSLTGREIYNPNSGQFENNGLGAPGHLQSARQGHTSIALANGQVLIAGGWTAGDDPSRTAELYTPQSQTFAYTSNMGIGRRYHAAAVLANDSVLMVAGFNGAGSAEVYTPDTGTFRFTENGLTEIRDFPTATSIFNTETGGDRKVLVAGGILGGTGSSNGTLLELYNPDENAFSAAGKMTTSRSQMTATLFTATR
jgi:hypothetical protein